VGLANLGSESETCAGSLVHLVGVSISFKKNFYQLPFTPPSLVRRIGPSRSPELPPFWLGYVRDHSSFVLNPRVHDLEPRSAI
jgi:hypothetical protein